LADLLALETGNGGHGDIGAKLVSLAVICCSACFFVGNVGGRKTFSTGGGQFNCPSWKDDTL